MFRKVRIAFVRRVESHQCDACLVGDCSKAFALCKGFVALQRFIRWNGSGQISVSQTTDLNPQQVLVLETLLNDLHVIMLTFQRRQRGTSHGKYWMIWH